MCPPPGVASRVSASGPGSVQRARVKHCRVMLCAPMGPWLLLALLTGAAAAGGRLPRTPQPPSTTPLPPPTTPRALQRNLTLTSRPSVRNRSVCSSLRCSILLRQPIEAATKSRHYCVWYVDVYAIDKTLLIQGIRIGLVYCGARIVFIYCMNSSNSLFCGTYRLV